MDVQSVAGPPIEAAPTKKKIGRRDLMRLAGKLAVIAVEASGKRPRIEVEIFRRWSATAPPNQSRSSATALLPPLTGDGLTSAVI